MFHCFDSDLHLFAKSIDWLLENDKLKGGN